MFSIFSKISSIQTDPKSTKSVVILESENTITYGMIG